MNIFFKENYYKYCESKIAEKSKLTSLNRPFLFHYLAYRKIPLKINRYEAATPGYDEGYRRTQKLGQKLEDADSNRPTMFTQFAQPSSKSSQMEGPLPNVAMHHIPF